MRSPQIWQSILTGCGVNIIDAGAWNEAFSQLVTPALFTIGEEEIADFVAECLHESQMLSRMEENLNYSPNGLVATFGAARAPASIAAQICRTPAHPADKRAIANLVYGGAWGLTHLGNAGPCDGWDYRGSGPIQVTGLYNFQHMKELTGIDIVGNPDALRTPGKEALAVTIAWWNSNVRDSQIGDVDAIRKTVNGPAALGLAEVRELTVLARSLLAQYGNDLEDPTNDTDGTASPIAGDDSQA